VGGKLSDRAEPSEPARYVLGHRHIRLDRLARRVPVIGESVKLSEEEAYSPEELGSFLNDFSTTSRSNIGSRSPPFAKSIMRLATMLTAGSVRSTKPNECKVSSNAAVMTTLSSGENAPSPKSDRIGIACNPASQPKCTLPYLGVPKAKITLRQGARVVVRNWRNGK
jgi:hypothetical protein